MKLLCATAARALSSPVETTLQQILVEYELDSGEGLLLSIIKIQEVLAHFDIGCSPPIGTLGLEDPRVLSLNSKSAAEIALSEIQNGETAAVEFKSSLLFDWKKFEANPHLSADQCRLDALVHSVLKTTAAFANTDGGVLYVGVTDGGAICGLANDFLAVNPKRADYDGWEQFLRGQVESRFIDGKSVNPYIRTEEITVNDLKFIRVQVASRSELSFLKKAGEQCELYIRSGTRSVPIGYEDIQKHYQLIRKF
ncbi:helix-turn-helix domain-containing protein [Rhizobium giardinii]|uniref:AlbA family DNA-binding domain-containing protein n=1 Tax=Rhizobium giardinii TaxID=56731 RepID=UPI0039E0E3CA